MPKADGNSIEKLPRRSRKYGVGKDIGGAVYLHRNYERLFGSVVAKAKRYIPEDFAYTVVKYCASRGAVSFIESADFDTAPEPTVGAIWTVFSDARTTFLRQATDPFIYHHKWLFVSDDYLGFDVSVSKARSTAWMSLEAVDKSRIGRRSFWSREVLSRLEADRSGIVDLSN